jgi:hypothetical protein
MSAWLTLLLSDGSDEHMALCNAALKEIRDGLISSATCKLAAHDPQHSEGFSEGVAWAIRTLNEHRK